MSTDLQSLVDLGFEQVGEWSLNKDILACKLEKYQKVEKILYAFVAEGKVRYIGKSVKALAQRMQQYKTPDPTQRTNTANNARLRQLLETKVAVQIYALVPDPKEALSYRNMPINVAAGLEDQLIEQFAPP